PLVSFCHASIQLLLVDHAFLYQQSPQRLDSLLEITEPVVEVGTHLLSRAADLIGAHDFRTLGAERVADDDGQLFPGFRLRTLGVDRAAIQSAEIVIAASGFL